MFNKAIEDLRITEFGKGCLAILAGCLIVACSKEDVTLDTEIKQNGLSSQTPEFPRSPSPTHEWKDLKDAKDIDPSTFDLDHQTFVKASKKLDTLLGLEFEDKMIFALRDKITRELSEFKNIVNSEASKDLNKAYRDTLIEKIDALGRFLEKDQAMGIETPVSELRTALTSCIQNIQTFEEEKKRIKITLQS